MRVIGGVWLIAMILLGGCAGSPRAEQAKPDPTKEAAYLKAVEQLTALNRHAEEALKRGRRDEAGAAIAEGQALQAKLLAPPHPTLAAMEAASDRDDLYARMLFSNRHDVWARTLYDKNVARWRAWKPQTADTLRRLRQAQDGVAACDRRMGR